MKTGIAIFIAIFLNSIAIASPLVEGEYQGGFHGYMTVKRINKNQYKIWLGVSGGSCGGLVHLNKSSYLKDDRFIIKYKDGKHTCTTSIKFEDDVANVSDSCITEKDEVDSTCAMMGEYSRIDR